MTNYQTLVAVYDTAAHAEAAVSDLKANNVPAEAISQHAKATTASMGTAAPAHHEEGFWSKLFGGSSAHDASTYDRNIARGGSVISVRASGDEHDRISAILEKHNPIDLDDHEGHGSGETTTTRATTAPGLVDRGAGADATLGARGTAGGDKMQLAEENLSVGKRATQGGTTRIRKYVVTTPVEEQIGLHSEKVVVDRQAVNDGRPVGDSSFRDHAVEMTERGEEAVVSKTARVKEEIGLRREGSDRTETVKDNVRREEAEVEQVASGGRSTQPGQPATAAPGQRKI